MQERLNYYFLLCDHSLVSDINTRKNKKLYHNTIKYNSTLVIKIKCFIKHN